MAGGVEGKDAHADFASRHGCKQAQIVDFPSPKGSKRRANAYLFCVSLARSSFFPNSESLVLHRSVSISAK